jgi:hypothetical protein
VQAAPLRSVLAALGLHARAVDVLSVSVGSAALAVLEACEVSSPALVSRTRSRENSHPLRGSLRFLSVPS